MIADYHTHTFRCGHASGTLDEYVEEAIRKGLDEIALTDHLFLYYEDGAVRDPSLAMKEGDYPAHFEEMLRVRDRHASSIAVRVSVEADWVVGWSEQLRSILSTYAFDFVLGGVHYVDGWLVDSPDEVERYESLPLDVIYRTYLREVRAAAESGLFHVIAHFDLPKKFGHRPPVEVRDDILATLDHVKRSGCALETSSVGFRDPVGESYPAPWIVEEMSRREIPIVLASDAHAPAEVGHDFDRLLGIVRDAGYRSVMTFEAGRPIPRSL